MWENNNYNDVMNVKLIVTERKYSNIHMTDSKYRIPVNIMLKIKMESKRNIKHYRYYNKSIIIIQ